MSKPSKRSPPPVAVRVRKAADKLLDVATASTRLAAQPAWQLGSFLCALLNCEQCRGKAQAWWVLDPRVNLVIGYWDLVTTAALLFTAVVTPMEVGFLDPVPPEERITNGLFIANRIVDLVFVRRPIISIVPHPGCGSALPVSSPRPFCSLAPLCHPCPSAARCDP